MLAYIKSTLLELFISGLMYVCMFLFCMYKLIAHVGMVSMAPLTRLYALQQSLFQKNNAAAVTTHNPSEITPTTSCIFCAIHAGTISSTVIAQNDTAFDIKDIAPQAPIHYLIIPKKHIVNIQALEPYDVPLMSDITGLAQQLCRIDTNHAEFKLVSNNGKRAGQHVMHLHVHFLAGYNS